MNVSKPKSPDNLSVFRHQVHVEYFVNRIRRTQSPTGTSVAELCAIEESLSPSTSDLPAERTTGNGRTHFQINVEY